MVCIVAVLGSLVLAQRANADFGGPNRIVIENMNAGSTGWKLPWPGYHVANDIKLQIKGYPGVENINPGGTVPLKVTVSPAQTFTVDVFRLGDYHRTGGRLVEHLGPINGVTQPPCTIDKRWLMNVCSWSTSVSLHIPVSWISGVYVAVLSSADKHQSLIPFWVVDENRRSDILYVSSVNTYEAYNNFPYDPSPLHPYGPPQTGHSLYDYNSADGTPAVKVTFDRPFNSQYGGPGDGGLYDFESELIEFIERNGYDVSYVTEPVIDSEPWIVRFHKMIVIGGHAEYQTMDNYNALIDARNSGVGLAFISGNEIYWQVRYESNNGVPKRIVVGYKLARPDPVKNPDLRTIRWRDLGRPEQKLIGVQLPENGWMSWGGQPWVPVNTAHWAFAGTGLQIGDPVNGEIAGYEIDAYDSTVGPPLGTDYTFLSSTPFINYLGQTLTQNSSIYRGLGGNWVFASGSMDWNWALSPGGSSNGQLNNVRHSIQVMTNNIFNRMIHNH